MEKGELKSVEEIQKDYPNLFSDMADIDTPSEEAKYTGRWEGKVIKNNDPDKLGRVQIRIFNFYDDLPDDGIPWAIPDIMFIGSKGGNFIVPEINSIVRGYFDQGDIHKPIYDKLAFNAKLGENSQADSREDYPHKMILFQTDQGDYMTLNRKTGEWVFMHRTGSSIIFKGDGELQIDTGASEDGNNGDLNIHVLGNAKIGVDGDCEVTSLGTMKVDGVKVELGNNATKQLVDNLPNCVVTGAPHFIGNTNTFC